MELRELPEAQLIRMAQRGDAGAFERLYRLHSARVYALCMRMLKARGCWDVRWGMPNLSCTRRECGYENSCDRRQITTTKQGTGLQDCQEKMPANQRAGRF